MATEALVALSALVFAACFTPGPNNALLASSGAHFGLSRTVPHILGVALGFALMIFIVGFFLGGVFQRSTLLKNALEWGGATILLWLAWKIASSGGVTGRGGRVRPFSFVEAAAFQWINPKGWAMAVAITSQFVAAENPLRSALIVAAVCIVMGLTSASAWAAAGQALTRWINTQTRIRTFNITMGALIALGVVLLFFD
jgi:threonine/homoserine/homoserine lactone efflux protein